MKTYSKIVNKLFLGLVVSSLPLLSGCPDIGSSSKRKANLGNTYDSSTETIIVEQNSIDSNAPDSFTYGGSIDNPEPIHSSGPGPRMSAPAPVQQNPNHNTNPMNNNNSSSPVKMPKIIDRK